MSFPEIVLIVAVADNGAGMTAEELVLAVERHCTSKLPEDDLLRIASLGFRGALPWRLKSDIQRLKAITTGKPVVMGRKTFASIGRPLPGRTNIVVTRDTNFRARGVVVTNSFTGARAVALGDALRRLAPDIAVIGGAEIYQQWMDIADRLEVTEVHARPDGDTYFAAIDAASWEEVARVRNPAGPDDSADFSYVTYRRRRSH